MPTPTYEYHAGGQRHAAASTPALGAAPLRPYAFHTAGTA